MSVNVENPEKNEYPKVTSEYLHMFRKKGVEISIQLLINWCINFFFVDGLIVGTLVSFAGFITLLMAFCSPYWIESYEESQSSFKNMGLWEYCFKNFVYPYYQFPKFFHGCHNVFSHVSNFPVEIFSKLTCIFLGILCHSWVSSSRLVDFRPVLCNSRVCLVYDFHVYP